MENKQKNTLMWVLLGVAIVVVFLFPKIYSLVTKLTLPKVEKSKPETKEEVKKVTDEVISDIHFPLMRNSKYSKDTYYSLDVFTSSNMSDADKLLSAFLKLEKINIVNNTFKSTYMDLLIDNVLGKNIEYNLGGFYVPIDSNVDYKGYWNYNPNNGLFIYQGGNNGANTSIEYYNLEQKIKAEYDKRDIIIYYYVSFATLQDKNYKIYSDPAMTDLIAEGTLENNTLDDVFVNIDNKKKKIYKYVFKDTICSYSEYCLYEGKWVNDLK